MSNLSLRNACMAGVSMAILGLTSPASAVVIFQDNFETAPEVSSAAPFSGDTLDADPVAQVGTWILKDKGGPASEQVTNYSPPGAHGGNNYLRLQDLSDSQATGVFTAPQTQDVRIDAWVNNYDNDNRLLPKDSNGNIGTLISWGPGNKMRYYNAGFEVLSNIPWLDDTWQHLIVDLHLATNTFDISLDGNAATGLPMTYGTLTDFAQFTFAEDANVKTMSVDDVVVTVVPEPAGLAGLVLGGTLLKRRRN